MNWLHHVDLSEVWHHEDLTVLARAHALASRIRLSTWYTCNSFQLEPLLNELEHVKDEWHFDVVWEDIYELADKDRVWIELREDHQNERTSTDAD